MISEEEAASAVFAFAQEYEVTPLAARDYGSVASNHSNGESDRDIYILFRYEPEEHVKPGSLKDEIQVHDYREDVDIKAVSLKKFCERYLASDIDLWDFLESDVIYLRTSVEGVLKAMRSDFACKANLYRVYRSYRSKSLRNYGDMERVISDGHVIESVFYENDEDWYTRHNDDIRKRPKSGRYEKNGYNTEARKAINTGLSMLRCRYVMENEWVPPMDASYLFKIMSKSEDSLTRDMVRSMRGLRRVKQYEGMGSEFEVGDSFHAFVQRERDDEVKHDYFDDSLRKNGPSKDLTAGLVRESLK